MRIILLALALVALLASALLGQAGSTFEKWTPGTLDIHQINTGRGNAALVMMPDGTTMLIDAGNGGNLPPRGTPPKPDASRTPAEWIVRYVRAMGVADIDYGIVTHFHDDHMGAMAAVMKSIRVYTMFDRAWPGYTYPSADHAEFKNEEFLEYRELIRAGQTKGERLMPGRDHQIVLRHDRAKYPEFRVRSVAANGEVWSGQGTATTRLFPDLTTIPQSDWPTENMSSLAIKLSYGTFDYYTGGDIPGRPRPGYPAWHDVETAVARAVGPVEAAVVNHHGNRDSTNAAFVSALRPRLWIIPVWSSDHPGHDVLDRMYSTRLYPGARDVFATNMIEANRIVIGPLLDRLASSQGHIVIRVSPGGDQYRVFILDDTSETFRITRTFGPFLSEVAASRTPAAAQVPRITATSPELEQRDQPVTADDVAILARAEALLNSDAVWNRADDRDCRDDEATGKRSLFCALEKACIDVLGSYDHRRVALQEVRFAVEDATRGRDFAHRLRDFNNLPETRLSDIRRVLTVAKDRVSARLKKK